jgi:hypothetical protein
MVRALGIDEQSPGNTRNLVGKSDDGPIAVDPLLEAANPGTQPITLSIEMQHAGSGSVD